MIISSKDESSAVNDHHGKEFDALSRWTTCRLSNKPLRLPIVSDYKGNLLNKEAVLEWLLTPEKEDYSGQQIEMFKHIKSLKDIVDLGNVVDGKSSVLKCEVGDEVFGKSTTQFEYIASCGHVLPHKLLEQTSVDKRCPVCDGPYSEIDIVTINPCFEEEHNKLEQRARRLRSQGVAHNCKKISVGRKRKASSVDSSKKRLKK